MLDFRRRGRGDRAELRSRASDPADFSAKVALITASRATPRRRRTGRHMLLGKTISNAIALRRVQRTPLPRLFHATIDRAFVRPAAARTHAEA